MNVEKYLNKNGFSTTVEWGPERKFHFIIGKKIKGEAVTYTKEIEDALIKNQQIKGIQLPEFNKEQTDVDKGDSGIHSESACVMPEGRSTSGGSEQSDKGEPCDTVEREVDSEGKSETVLSKKPESGRSGILQPVMEESTEETVRNKDIQKVEKTPRTRRRSTTGKNSGSRSKSVVQKDAPQNNGVGDKDATC
jgi:hypothetical protein